MVKFKCIVRTKFVCAKGKLYSKIFAKKLNFRQKATIYKLKGKSVLFLFMHPFIFLQLSTFPIFFALLHGLEAA